MPLRSRFCVHAAGWLGAAVLCAVPALAATWGSNGTPVCATPGGVTEPVAVADGAGGVILAWTDHRGPASAIYAARLTSTGWFASGWTSGGRPVTQTSVGQYNPAITSDGSGGAIIAWVDVRGGAASGADIYAQHIAANGSNATGWPADGLPICRASYYQGPPVMCTDQAGGAYIAWQNGHAGAKDVVSVTRVTGAGALATGWSECGYALGDGTWHESDPEIALDDGGGVLVTWSDCRLSASGVADIMSARLTAAGAPDSTWSGWVCRASGDQDDPVVISDGAGGALFAWQDGRNPAGDDIYAQHIVKSGSIAPAWPADGAPVSASPGAQFDPRMVGDGQGGAIVVWSDGNTGIGNVSDVRAQRLSGAGAVASSWPEGGLLCHSAPYGSIFRGVTADGAGGVVIAAEDASLSTGVQYDVYVDHVTGLGVLDRARYPACVEAHQQQSTVVVSDGSGGAILAWQDLRAASVGSLNFALFAQHVGAGDVVLDVPGHGGPPAFSLEGARPNPSRGDLAVAFTLPDASPASLQLVDVSGRTLASLDVGGLGAGRHVVRLAGGTRATPGICWVRLARQGSVLAARVVVLR